MRTATSRSSSAIAGFAESPIAQQTTSHTDLVPRQFLSAPDDASLVTFARQKHAVSRAGQFERELNGIPPVRTAKKRLTWLRTCGLGPSRDLRDDGVRIFESRILARYYADIGQPVGDRSLH